MGRTRLGQVVLAWAVSSEWGLSFEALRLGVRVCLSVCFPWIGYGQILHSFISSSFAGMSLCSSICRLSVSHLAHSLTLSHTHAHTHTLISHHVMA
mmetsp:Transcript_26860/g.77109  ORF Transcript_26860/g.77109 Transcript_26860/m.77109 type:complete len:96 (-) Transcript_26860:711-998(-)